mgnify:CR=1 FL=1
MSSIIKVDTVQDQDGNNIINENANTITIGKSGDTVTVAGGATFVGGGIQWQSTIVTGATHTVSANQGIWIDTSSNACTLTLPASPSVGDQVVFTDYARNWGTNAVTLTLNGSKFQGNTTPVPVYDTTGESVDIVFSGSTKGWIPNTDGAVALETPQTADIEYLAVAGGGSGGRGNSGAGGAGGLLTNFGGTALSLTTGTVLTATVGAGGAAVSTPAVGNQGANSTISGPGISTVTALGGGAGGKGNAISPGTGTPGGAGGSGGGAGYGGIGGSGTSPQGNDGGTNNPASASPKYGGAGGGGAGAVGASGSNNAGGAGGNGSANSITGSSVTYAGGGGGSVDSSGGGGAGGSGGGGAGSYNVQGPGTDGLGGGGGAIHTTQDSGKGGDGVVILTMADGDYSGTSTGSPTVATNVGGTGKTTVKFTGNGTYTV